MKRLIHFLAASQPRFINLLRLAIFLVMLWIGSLKAFHYEADGIVPFVANSPFMRFLYTEPAQYRQHMNREGEEVPVNREWHKKNGTYTFALVLGLVIISIGGLTFSGIWFPRAGLAGGLLTAGMSVVTLSFLVSTPEAYVEAGGPVHGFPFLSGSGRLVVKDLIMLMGGLVCAAESARQLLAAKEKETWV